MMVDSSAREQVAEIYRGLLKRDKRAEADLVADIVKLLAPDMQLEGGKGGRTKTVDNSGLDLSEMSEDDQYAAFVSELDGTAQAARNKEQARYEQERHYETEREGYRDRGILPKNFE